MNPKIIMTLSAIYLGLLGVILLFAPHELIRLFDIQENEITILFIKLLSGMYLGFSYLNWMTKEGLIGGIYKKPITLSNTTHFDIGTIALLKTNAIFSSENTLLLVLTITYSIFALLFSFLFFRNSVK